MNWHFVLVGLTALTPVAAEARPSVAFEKAANQLQIEIEGRPFATYVWQDRQVARPYFAHIHAPGGKQVTRRHPPIEGKDAGDHATMHPGLWLAFGDLAGADFWRNKGRVEHVEFVVPPRATPEGGEFAVRNRYRSGEKTLLEEVCRIRIRVRPQGYLLDWTSEFTGPADFAFGDQEEMGLGVRMATGLTVKNGGEILDSEGRRNPKQVWGTQSSWCDYSGTLDGQTVGVMLMPDPKNFRRSWFHARDYGLLVANPFGQKAFTKGPPSKVMVRKGETFRLRFGVLVHAGKADLPAAYRDWAGDMPWVEVSKDRRGFTQTPSGKPFVVWGFNYDHDDAGRLLEDYWEAEWAKVERDFEKMKQLGANVVRIHLQTARFLDGPSNPNRKALDQLARLLRLAERVGLYLDLTGLGCYHKKDVPAWYDELPEKDRWNAQAVFWQAIAATCKNSPAVFCYDLMNEPVVPGGKRKPGDWLGPAFGGKHFVQFITLDQKGRPRPEIARQWIRQLTTAIRKEDRRHLITVGLVDWSLDRPGLTSGFVPKEIVADLDFLCVHIYPENGKVEKALETLAGFSVGKPVLIEETFPLKCSIPEFQRFVEGSRKHAAGWVGFYWGKPPEELRGSGKFADALLLAWLEYFQKAAAPARD